MVIGGILGFFKSLPRWVKGIPYILLVGMLFITAFESLGPALHGNFNPLVYNIFGRMFAADQFIARNIDKINDGGSSWLLFDIFGNLFVVWLIIHKVFVPIQMKIYTDSASEFMCHVVGFLMYLVCEFIFLQIAKPPDALPIGMGFFKLVVNFYVIFTPIGRMLEKIKPYLKTLLKIIKPGNIWVK